MTDPNQPIQKEIEYMTDTDLQREYSDTNYLNDHVECLNYNDLMYEDTLRSELSRRGIEVY